MPGQDLTDRGLEPGSTSAEQAEMRAARRRIRKLENELAGDEYGVEPICEQLPIAPFTYFEHKRRERPTYKLAVHPSET